VPVLSVLALVLPVSVLDLPLAVSTLEAEPMTVSPVRVSHHLLQS
jgi:hypothetical protein